MVFCSRNRSLSGLVLQESPGLQWDLKPSGRKSHQCPKNKDTVNKWQKCSRAEWPSGNRGSGSHCSGDRVAGEAQLASLPVPILPGLSKPHTQAPNPPLKSFAWEDLPRAAWRVVCDQGCTGPCSC